ncbi:MAG: hypothetical protein LBS54_03435 [Dysgonamonadaceae bacterium]|jgi:hypothetical protein|nr:hypothetical protein [Dysgonamonadaceae bacterium]
MFVVTVFIYILFVAVLFGLTRLYFKLNEKWREIILFTLLYLIPYAGMLSELYLWKINDGVNLDCLINIFDKLIFDFVYYSVFYLPPTFVVAYILYPFKKIRRSRILIWILSIFTVLSWIFAIIF